MSLQSGLLIGIVKDVSDPSGFGRIRVTFPTMGGVQSAWAPVAGDLAGNNRGSWIMPELDDECIVGFDNGHFDQPYILGFVWNGKDKTPETDKDFRIIKTPGGHQLRFEDKQGSKKVIVQTDGGLTITMDDSQKSIEIKGGGRAVTMQNGELKIT